MLVVTKFKIIIFAIFILAIFSIINIGNGQSVSISSTHNHIIAPDSSISYIVNNQEKIPHLLETFEYNIKNQLKSITYFHWIENWVPKSKFDYKYHDGKTVETKEYRYDNEWTLIEIIKYDSLQRQIFRSNRRQCYHDTCTIQYYIETISYLQSAVGLTTKLHKKSIRSQKPDLDLVCSAKYDDKGRILSQIQVSDNYATQSINSINTIKYSYDDKQKFPSKIQSGYKKYDTYFNKEGRLDSCVINYRGELIYKLYCLFDEFGRITQRIENSYYLHGVDKEITNILYNDIHKVESIEFIATTNEKFGHHVIYRYQYDDLITLDISHNLHRFGFLYPTIKNTVENLHLGNSHIHLPWDENIRLLNSIPNKKSRYSVDSLGQETLVSVDIIRIKELN